MFRKTFILFFIVLVGVGLMSCETPTSGDVNQAPYNIIGPTVLQLVPYTPITSINVTLVVDQASGLDDPDGDSVTYNYELVSTTIPLGNQHLISASWSSAGIINLSWDENLQDEEIIFKFWTQDPDGLQSTEFFITFKYLVIT